MGDHHMHITSVLIEDADRVQRFIDKAAEIFHCAWLVPGPRAWAVAMVSKDFDNVSSELEMPGICKELEGILEGDITVASAWEYDDGTRERTSLWRIKGSGR